MHQDDDRIDKVAFKESINNNLLNDIMTKCTQREGEKLEDFELRRIFKIPAHLLTTEQKHIRDKAAGREKYKLEKHKRYHDMQHEIACRHWESDEEIYAFVQQYLMKSDGDQYSDLTSDDEGEDDELLTSDSEDVLYQHHDQNDVAGSNLETEKSLPSKATLNIGTAAMFSPHKKLHATTNGPTSANAKPKVRGIS